MLLFLFSSINTPEVIRFFQTIGQHPNLNITQVFGALLRIPKLYLYFLLYTGDCNHLEPYPVYSDVRNKYTNLTTWDKPWRPEIDWLNSYVNLSSFHRIVLYGLTLGYRVTKKSKYFSNSVFGCKLMFLWDAELADDYYIRNFANTNYTMVICTPWFPVRADMRRKYVQLYPGQNALVGCYVYKVSQNVSLNKTISKVSLANVFLLSVSIWCWQL